MSGMYSCHPSAAICSGVGLEIYTPISVLMTSQLLNTCLPSIIFTYIFLLFKIYIYSSITVHPIGIPESPDGQVAPAFLTNVPVAATPFTQSVFQFKPVV